MKKDLLELIRLGLGDDTYADLLRRAGWYYKTRISLIKRDNFTVKYYHAFLRDINAKFYVEKSDGTEEQIDLNVEKTDFVDAVIGSAKVSKTEIAEMWGVERRTAWGRIQRASFTIEDLARILKSHGAIIKIRLDNGMLIYPKFDEDDEVSWNIMEDFENANDKDIIVEEKQTEVGMVRVSKLHYHGDITGVSDGVRYWTNRSLMISTFDDEESGIIKDLFRSEDGKFFFAIYDLKTREPLRVRSATLDDARLFVAGHGLI